jgi:hypothetical protein
VKILNINQLETKDDKASIVLEICVVKNVHLQKCIKDAFVNFQKIVVEISFLAKDVNSVVVWDVILRKNLMDLLPVLQEINLSKVKIITLFLMKQS